MFSHFFQLISAKCCWRFEFFHFFQFFPPPFFGNVPGPLIILSKPVFMFSIGFASFSKSIFISFQFHFLIWHDDQIILDREIHLTFRPHNFFFPLKITFSLYMNQWFWMVVIQSFAKFPSLSIPLKCCMFLYTCCIRLLYNCWSPDSLHFLVSCLHWYDFDGEFVWHLDVEVVINIHLLSSISLQLSHIMSCASLSTCHQTCP